MANAITPVSHAAPPAVKDVQSQGAPGGTSESESEPAATGGEGATPERYGTDQHCGAVGAARIERGIHPNGLQAKEAAGEEGLVAGGPDLRIVCS
jgi:hypothetical protein